MPVTDTATLIISAKADSARVDEFTKAVDRADEHSKELIKTLGGLLSTGMMVNFGRQAISTFSDLQESTQKFYEVFKGLDKEAGLAAENLEKSFGASQRSAKSMLSLTGDLLTGFGFSREEALKLSIQVAQLGSDIASFANYSGGAEGATIAITKAMLGETEMAKMLGITIKTDSKEFQELMKSIKETRGVTDAQAKALAALQTAFEQKKTAMGDFERNINSIANRGRMLSNELEDLKANIGRGLSESFSEGQAAGIRLLKVFNDLSPEAQDFITKTGAIATGLFAVKTAMSTYTAIQGISSALTAKHTAGTLAEADAHIKNAKAIQAENMARSGGVTASANPLLDIGKQIKANKKQTLFAKHDLQQANLSGNLKEIEKAKQAYRSLLVERRKLYQNLGIEQANQGVAKFNANLAGTNQRMAQVGNQFGRFQKQMTTFPTLAKGANALRSGIAGVATGAKVATGAVWGLTKAFLPMLAVSVAIEGIDYLINRTKRSAEAQNTLAEKDAQSAKNLLASNEALRKSDREKLLQYEQLASYTNRTAKEQELLNNLTKELNGTYDGLNLPLLKQNKTLKDTSKLWDEINKKQHKNRQEDLKNVYSKDSRSLQTEGMKLQETANTFMSRRSDRDALRDAINITNLEQRQRVLGQMRGVYVKRENVEMVEAIDNYLAKMQQMKKSRKEYYESLNQKAPTGKQTSDTKPITETLDALKNLKKEQESFKEKKWNFAFELADPQKQVKMLDEKLKELTKQRKDALERAPHDRGQQANAIKISQKMMDIEKQKAEIMKRADADRVSKMEEQKRKLDEQIAIEKQFAMSLYQTNMKFRETAVTPTSSNSLDAIRLQSRSFLGSGNALQNLQKQTADSAKKSAVIASESKKIQENMEKALKEIYSKIEKFSTSSVGG